MNLSPQQIEAVETDAAAVLVCAPAGSGKTAVFAHRIAHLIRNGVDPSNILALTFTRAAARNIRDRLLVTLGDDAEQKVRDMTIGTVHSVTLRILQTYGDRIGYAPTRISVIDPEDADMLLRLVCESLGHCNAGKWKGGLSFAKAQGFVEAANAGADAREIMEMGGRAARDIVQEFNTSMYRNNAVTFGRILTECRRLLTLHPDVLARYQKRWLHVQVDEVQDSAQVEFSLYELLAPPANLFMVGDLRQSIFGFRYARPDLLENMIAERRVRVIDLEQSFRCPGAVADAANRLIAHNPGFSGKPMISASGRRGCVEVLTGRSADITARVVSALASGYRPGEVAVLARTHAVLRRLAGLFYEAKIPFHRVGRTFDVAKTAEFRTIRAMLRLIANRRDDLAFMVIADRLGITDLSKFSSEAKSNSISLWQHYAESHGCADSNPTSQWIQEIIAAIASNDDLTPTMGVIAAVAETTATSEAEADVWKFWQTHCDDMSVAEALDWFGCHNANADAQEDLGDRQAVTLATVHGAKGLEWPCVIVCEMNDGNFPSARSLKESGGEDEERRLAYVAMTRAKELLVLHHRRPEDQNQDRQIKRSSRFLEEAGVLAGEAVPA